jgi:hypothetical protein
MEEDLLEDKELLHFWLLEDREMLCFWLRFGGKESWISG